MAYNLPDLTPAQLALPLRVGAFYMHTNGILNRWWDLELLSFNEVMGMCKARTRNNGEPELVRLSYLRSRYKVRES
jgi:hypothetical protein